MALPATTPDFAPKSTDTTAKPTKTVSVTTGKPIVLDPRKVAAQELANAQKALFDAEDALKAATDLVTEKERAFATVRRPAAGGKRA
jgi:hypothetical protein